MSVAASRRNQAIAGAANGLDHAATGDRVELAAQVTDVDLDRVDVDARAVAPHIPQQVVLGPDCSVGAHEVLQNLRFTATQRNTLCPDTNDPAPRVEREVVEDDVLTQPTSASAKERVTARDEDGELERLAHIVIRSGVERARLVAHTV